MHIKIVAIPKEAMRPTNLEIHRDYYTLHDYFEDGFTIRSSTSFQLKQIGITNCLVLEKNGVDYVCSFGEEPATLIIDQTVDQAIEGYHKLSLEQQQQDHVNFMEFIKNFTL
jgi:hypothetical protein